ncbi:hypothetical protein TTX_1482 [Thermoproteus tenax Kra 1]|uniref:Uncharacterized protein n=1 Tax=Thermoproteus tenax (strain ATCC 35583 / DSM 2078 / JCM 9277 / NBRC 100435 / Kra 1) TaxID=768679 RepID=G4RKL7_THETK|nr:hypothetical protein TTX_1482 [Thermoproteus tenax Kra 1]
MNITIDLLLFGLVVGLGIYILYKIEYDLKIIKTVKSFPVVPRVRGEGLIDFTNLSLLLKNYEIEYQADKNVYIERIADNIYKVRSSPPGGRALFKIKVYGNFDEYIVEKAVDVVS